jgi:hypothetical protein
MLKKYMITPLLLAVLGAAFILVSFLVFISRGKDAFIRQKLRIGALILTLTALSLSCQTNQNDMVLCYKAAFPASRITIENEISQNREIIVDALGNRTISGIIEEDTEKHASYSYRIVDTKDTLLQKGELAVTASEDQKSAPLSFKITIDQDIPAGTYILRLYNSDLKTQDKHVNSYFYSSQLQLLEIEIMCYDMAF